MPILNVGSNRCVSNDLGDEKSHKFSHECVALFCFLYFIFMKNIRGGHQRLENQIPSGMRLLLAMSATLLVVNTLVGQGFRVEVFRVSPTRHQ
jgi:hypothetical protein